MGISFLFYHMGSGNQAWVTGLYLLSHLAALPPILFDTVHATRKPGGEKGGGLENQQTIRGWSDEWIQILPSLQRAVEGPCSQPPPSRAALS